MTEKRYLDTIAAITHPYLRRILAEVLMPVAFVVEMKTKWGAMPTNCIYRMATSSSAKNCYHKTSLMKMER